MFGSVTSCVLMDTLSAAVHVHADCAVTTVTVLFHAIL